MATLLILSGAAYVAETSTFPVALPFLTDALHLPSSATGELVSAFNVLLVVGLAAGSLAQVYVPPYRLFCIGLAGFGAGSVLLASSSNFDQLMLARYLQGFGAGVFTPLVPALISAVHAEAKNRVLSTWAFWTGIAAAACPLLFPLLTGLVGWRWFGLALGGCAACALLLGRTVGRPAVAAAKEDLGSVTARDALHVVVVLAYVVMIYGAITLALVAIPKIAFDTQPPVMVGLLGAAPWAAFSVGCFWVGHVDPRRHVALLVAAVLLCSLAIGLMGALDGVLPALLVSVLIGLAMSLANVPTTSLLLSLAPPGLGGLLATLDICAARLGGAIFVLSFVDTRGGWPVIGLMVASACLLGCLPKRPRTDVGRVAA